MTSTNLAYRLDLEDCIDPANDRQHYENARSSNINANLFEGLFHKKKISISGQNDHLERIKRIEEGNIPMPSSQSYDLRSKNTLTIDEISRSFNISREDIRQMAHRGIFEYIRKDADPYDPKNKYMILEISARSAFYFYREMLRGNAGYRTFEMQSAYDTPTILNHYNELLLDDDSFETENINEKRITDIILKEIKRINPLDKEEENAVKSNIVMGKNGLEIELADTVFMKGLLDSLYQKAILGKLKNEFMYPLDAKKTKNEINEDFIEKYNAYLSIYNKTRTIDGSKDPISKIRSRIVLSNLIGDMYISQEQIDNAVARFKSSYWKMMVLKQDKDFLQNTGQDTDIKIMDLEKRIGITLSDTESMNRIIDTHTQTIMANKERIYLSHLYLVIYHSKMEPNKFSWGTEGLKKAAERFNYNSDIRFKTCALAYIKNEIIARAIETQRPILIPRGTLEEISRLEKTKKSLLNELGRKPTHSEIIDRRNQDAEKLNNNGRSRNIPSLTRSRYDYIMDSINPSYISLNSPIGEDADNNSFENMFYDPQNWKKTVPEYNVENSSMKKSVDNILSRLDSREEEILRLRFGFAGEEYTLEEIGKKYGITKERTRQIVEKSVLKLKKHLRINNPDISIF